MYRNRCYRIAFVLLCFNWLLACGKKTAPKEHASEITNPVKESDLTTIRLSPKAVSRLGITTVAAAYRQVPRSYKLGGEIMAVPGKSVAISAPLKGTLLQAESGQGLQVGSRVRKGQVLFRLLVLPAESDLISLQADIRAKEVQLETAAKGLNRTRQLLADKAASVKQVEQTQADYAGALNALRNTRSKANLLKGSDPNTLAKSNSTLLVRSPVNGLLLQVNAAANQTVNAGAPLAHVADVNPVWVRVPLYEGSMAALNQQSRALVQHLSGTQGSATGRLVSAPVSSDPGTATTDLFYEIANDQGKFMPGQKVNVSLSLQQTEKSLVVPYAAILYDLNGGQWVYTNPEANVFIRKRVEVQAITDSLAILTRGIGANTKVVTNGAAELYGSEFGGGH